MNHGAKEFELMLEDMRAVDEMFVPSSYWRQYHGPSVDFIREHGINDFRSGRFPQWSAIFAFVNPYVRRVEELLAQLSSSPPRPIDAELARTLKSMVALADRQNEQATWLCLEWCRGKDSLGLMSRISDSGVGSPSIAIRDDGRLYTLPFLRYCAYYLHLHSRLSMQENMHVLEIGGGYGGLCEVFLKAHPRARYVNVDLPVQTYLAQQYLSEVFQNRVIPYSETRTLDVIDINGAPPGSIVTLCPWQLPRVRGEFDLLVNTASFQEMSQPQVKMYADEITRLNTKYVFIVAIMQGIRSHATEEGFPFEPNPVTRQHYLTFFSEYDLQEETWPDFLPAIAKANRISGSLLFRHRRCSPRAG